MKVEDIVKEYLIKQHYDGLFNTKKDCSCELESNKLADCINNNCEPGIITPVEDGDPEEITLISKESLRELRKKKKKEQKREFYKEVILQYLHKVKQSNTINIIDNTGFSAPLINKILKKMKTEGKIVCKENRKNGREYIWEVKK